MAETQYDFEGLGNALQDHPTLRDPGKRGQLLTQYKVEILALLVGLHVAEVTGANERPADPAERCDLCSAPVQEQGLYVDGKVIGAGVFANLCATCFAEKGSGIGWGVGQLYRHDGAGWQCIGGGNPEPAEG